MTAVAGRLRFGAAAIGSQEQAWLHAMRGVKVRVGCHPDCYASDSSRCTCGCQGQNHGASGRPVDPDLASTPDGRRQVIATNIGLTPPTGTQVPITFEVSDEARTPERSQEPTTLSGDWTPQYLGDGTLILQGTDRYGHSETFVPASDRVLEPVEHPQALRRAETDLRAARSREGTQERLEKAEAVRLAREAARDMAPTQQWAETRRDDSRRWRTMLTAVTDDKSKAAANVRAQVRILGDNRIVGQEAQTGLPVIVAPGANGGRPRLTAAHGVGTGRAVQGIVLDREGRELTSARLKAAGVSR